MKILAPALLALALAGCAGLPLVGRDIGVVEDESARAFLRPLDLEDEAGCTLTAGGAHLAARCRVFRGPAEERVIGVYDLVTDRLLAILQQYPDGRQAVIWTPQRAFGIHVEVRV